MRSNLFFIAAIVAVVIPRVVYATGFQNPLTFQFIQQVLEGFITSIIYVGMPVLVVLIVIVGFRFVLAQGNAEALTTNRAFTLKVFVGSVIFIALWAVAQMLGASIGALSVGTVFVVITLALYLIFFKKQK